MSCGWLAPPDNGVKEGIRYLKDSKVYFHCNNGHSLVGTEISTCLASGKWSSPTPTCQPGEDAQSTSPSAAQPGLAPPTCLPLPHPPPSAAHLPAIWPWAALTSLTHSPGRSHTVLLSIVFGVLAVVAVVALIYVLLHRRKGNM